MGPVTDGLGIDNRQAAIAAQDVPIFGYAATEATGECQIKFCSERPGGNLPGREGKDQAI